jgi:NAD(P)-dependent dehydrogenase (short-subunit alcohol dehydrogenase family)
VNFVAKGIQIMELKPLCIVTGGAGFLGLSIVNHMLSKGFNVVSFDLADPSTKIENAEFIKCDITNFENMRTIITKITKKYGGIDVLINNAAIDAKVSSDLNSPIDFLSDNFETIHEEFNVSILGALICTQLVAFSMKSNVSSKNKSIVFVGSDLSVIAPNQNIYIDQNNSQTFFKPISYSLIKHAIVGIVKYLSVELSKYNIRVNCVSPGPIAHEQPDYLVKNLFTQIPLKRLARIDDIVGVIEFLASVEASYITGQNLLIDGGRSVW